MTAYRVSVDELTLHDAAGDGRSLHYERDHDLTVNTKTALGGGTQAAIILLELGIDGHETHRARLDFGFNPAEDGEEVFTYDRRGDEVRALTDAIDTLTALRDHLESATSDWGR